MKREEQERFREVLHELKEKIETSLAVADPSEESITPDNAIGRLTRMEAIQAQSMSAAAKRRQQSRLRKIERALQRIEKGTYGTCATCGEEIPEGRLEIMPETSLCVKCAARR